MPPDFNLPFVLSLVGAFLTSSVVAYTYVWPAVRAMPRHEALGGVDTYRIHKTIAARVMTAR